MEAPEDATDERGPVYSAVAVDSLVGRLVRDRLAPDRTYLSADEPPVEFYSVPKTVLASLIQQYSAEICRNMPPLDHLSFHCTMKQSKP